MLSAGRRSSSSEIDDPGWIWPSSLGRFVAVTHVGGHVPALKAFFAREINTRSNVLANPMLACMTLVSQLYLSSQSLAKLASLSSTLLEIGALFARFARSS